MTLFVTRSAATYATSEIVWRPQVLGSMKSVEQYLTVSQIAEILGCSYDTASRRFESLPGVIDLGSAEKRHKRRYRLLRVSRSTFEKYLAQHQARSR